jgi:transposase InsO family protein
MPRDVTDKTKLWGKGGKGYFRVKWFCPLLFFDSLYSFCICAPFICSALLRSVTSDNGKDFAEHRRLAEALDLEIYFALPYRSWQRGTNENTNGLLRQFFPKGTDFSRISHREVARVENLLNERPRRRLGYRTPAKVLSKRLCCN